MNKIQNDNHNLQTILILLEFLIGIHKFEVRCGRSSRERSEMYVHIKVTE